MTVFSEPHQRIRRRAFRTQDAGSRFEDIHLGGGLSNVPITRARQANTGGRRVWRMASGWRSVAVAAVAAGGRRHWSTLHRKLKRLQR